MAYNLRKYLPERNGGVTRKQYKRQKVVSVGRMGLRDRSHLEVSDRLFKKEEMVDGAQ